MLKAWAGRQLQPRRHGSFSLVWQVSPSTWEADWVRSLFAGSTTEDIVDLNHKVMRPGMVVVDNLLTAEKSEYYRAAFMAGHSVSLIHLSDEAIKDDLSCYDWCDKVFRTYWSPALAGFSDILTFPLGYKSGLASAVPPPPAAGRPYLWSFAGDASKSSRGDMLAALKAVPNGKLHLTSGFDAGERAADRRVPGSAREDGVHAVPGWFRQPGKLPRLGGAGMRFDPDRGNPAEL